MHPPDRYGLFCPCLSHEVRFDGRMELELPGGQRIAAVLDGVRWPDDRHQAETIRSYIAQLLLAADRLSCLLQLPLTESGGLDIEEASRRYAGEASWPAAVFIDDRDLADYLREHWPLVRAA